MTTSVTPYKKITDAIRPSLKQEAFPCSSCGSGISLRSIHFIHINAFMISRLGNIIMDQNKSESRPLGAYAPLCLSLKEPLAKFDNVQLLSQPLCSFYQVFPATLARSRFKTCVYVCFCVVIASKS